MPCVLSQSIVAAGGTVGAIAISHVDGLRGLSTTAPIAAGEPLLSLPPSLALFAHEPSEPLRRLELELATPLAEHERIACGLLQRLTGPNALPRPYVDSLPRQMPPPSPSWLWDPDELDLLGAPRLKSMSLWRRGEARRLAGELEKVWPPSGSGAHPPSEAQVEWALAIATSRSLAATAADGGAILSALAPLCDMMNHAPRAEDSVQLVHEGDRLVLRAIAPIEKGAPVEFSYGEISDEMLLLQYGFVLADGSNPHEECVASIGALLRASPSDAAHRCVQLRLLEPDPKGGGANTQQPAGPKLQEATLQLVLAQSAAEAEAVGGGGGGGNGEGGGGGGGAPSQSELLRRWQHAYQGGLKAALEDIERAEVASEAAVEARREASQPRATSRQLGGAPSGEHGRRLAREATAAQWRHSQRRLLSAELEASKQQHW